MKMKLGRARSKLFPRSNLLPMEKSPGNESTKLAFSNQALILYTDEQQNEWQIRVMGDKQPPVSPVSFLRKEHFSLVCWFSLFPPSERKKWRVEDICFRALSFDLSGRYFGSIILVLSIFPKLRKPPKLLLKIIQNWIIQKFKIINM